MVQQTTEDLASLVLNKIQKANTCHPLPPQGVLKEFFEALFYTSLRTEEGDLIQLNVTLISEDNPDPKPPARIVKDRWQYTRLKEKQKLSVKNLVKISKAVDPWSSSLAVCFDDIGGLWIWGIIDQSVHYQSFLHFEAESGPEQPGLFQASIKGIGEIYVVYDYDLLATLKQGILIDHYIDVFKNGPIKDYFSKLVKKYVGSRKQGAVTDDSLFGVAHIERYWKSAICRILIKVISYRHGGALLITSRPIKDINIKYGVEYRRLSKAINNVLKSSEIAYRASNEIFELIDGNVWEIPTDLYLEEKCAEGDKNESENELKGATRFISSLSCVDGLVLMDESLNVLGFGAVINIKDTPRVVHICNSPNVLESTLTCIKTHDFGTRHRSMFSYCWNNSDSLGFVVSEDGDLRAVMRVCDKLVMWENLDAWRHLDSRDFAER